MDIKISIAPKEEVVENVSLYPRLAFSSWQDRQIESNPNLYKVRKWGDPIMIAQGGFTTTTLGTISKSNFQAIKLWSPEGGWGGVSNFLFIPHNEIMNLSKLQVEDDFLDKEDGWNREYNCPQWLAQKMNWLIKEDGTIYMTRNSTGNWTTLDRIRWGTIALGGNLVLVEGYETFTLDLPEITRKEKRVMARLSGFKPADWNLTLTEQLRKGITHRCFCAYRGDSIGDSPKGITYSPFYSPQSYDFMGTNQPKAFYIPKDWLEYK